jgi:hypothetical protein
MAPEPIVTLFAVPPEETHMEPTELSLVSNAYPPVEMSITPLLLTLVALACPPEEMYMYALLFSVVLITVPLLITETVSSVRLSPLVTPLEMMYAIVEGPFRVG